VLFGSIVGRQGAPGSAPYSATKAWVQVLGEGLQVDGRRGPALSPSSATSTPRPA